MSDTIVTGAPAPTTTSTAPATAPTPASIITETPAAPAAATPAAPDWMSGLSEDLKGYAQNKQFKDPATVVESYKHLEKLMGTPKEHLLKLPQKEDDAEGWNGVYNKLGRPEKADDYKIQAPENSDENFTKWAKSTFHELGLSAKQAEKLSSKYNEYFSGVATQHQETFNQKLTSEVAALKKEWGGAFEQNRQIAAKAMDKFGFTNAEVDAIANTVGFSRMSKLLHSIGSQIGEDQFVTGKNPGMGGALTPSQAKEKISALRSDKTFITRYTSGELSAVEEMKKLHDFAFPAE